MKRNLLWSGIILLVVPACAPEAPKDKVLKDTWDAAYLEGAKNGYVHTTARAGERDGQKIITTTIDMSLTTRRFNEVVTMRIQTGNEETPDGKVLSVFLTQFAEQGKQLTLTGRVEGDKLMLKAPNAPNERAVPWNPRVLGLYKQTQLFKDRKVKPGDSFDYLNYEPGILMPFKVKVRVKEPQEVDVLEVKKGEGKPRVERVKQTLLRAEAVPDKVEIGGNAVPLPKFVLWLDGDSQPVRSQMELPGQGIITMYRTTEAVARQEGVAPALLPDLGLESLITLNRAIDNVHQAKSAVYRITAKDDDDPKSIFVQDDRQQVKNLKGQTFDLEVKTIRPQPREQPGVVGAEYLKSSFFLNSDDPHVRSLAARIVREETDSWKRAQKIEDWVHRNMTVNDGLGFITAGQIARDLKGDCRQHAMLAAALCRAAGVPSRTALGLVYGNDRKRGPLLAFHMWTEVWIKGQWLPVDATLGMGSIGAGHLKISDHSWADTQTLAPLLPVIRALGKIKVEVVSVE